MSQFRIRGAGFFRGQPATAIVPAKIYAISEVSPKSEKNEASEKLSRFHVC